ncbi:unnamed protein product, partial [Rotaria sp. Silwood1]
APSSIQLVTSSTTTLMDELMAGTRRNNKKNHSSHSNSRESQTLDLLERFRVKVHTAKDEQTKLLDNVQDIYTNAELLTVYDPRNPMAKRRRDESKRLDRSKVVESDDEQELLFSIPFNGAVKITGLCVIGENDPSHPNTVKLYVDISSSTCNNVQCLWSNLPELRFDNTRGKAHQEISLTYDTSGTLAYQVNPSHFSRVTHLSLYFPSNFGDETTRIYYIGLRGEYLGEVKSKIVTTTYEARPQLKDHKVDDFLTGNREIQ